MAASFTPTAEMVDAVADWHARHGGERIARPLMPHLRERFSLSNLQAVEVIRAANEKGGADESAS